LVDDYREGRDLAGKYRPGQTTRDLASQWYHENLSNAKPMDGINNAPEGDAIVVSRNGTILGGHHRWDELQTRIDNESIDRHAYYYPDLWRGVASMPAIRGPLRGSASGVRSGGYSAE
jgi:hypothetical protein